MHMEVLLRAARCLAALRRAQENVQLARFQPSGRTETSREHPGNGRRLRPTQQLPGRNTSGRKEARAAGREKELRDNEKGNNSWRRNERVWPRRHRCRSIAQGAPAPISFKPVRRESKKKGLLIL